MAAPVVSIKALQAQLDSLLELCPVLPPAVLPQGYDVEDLWALANTEGKSQNAALRKVVAQAAKELSSTGEPCCCVCGSGGEPSASSETEEDEGRTLRFTAFTSTSFVDRTIRLSKAGFACGNCRAMLNPLRFIRFAALRLSPEHPERQALAQELCVHFASVNKVDENIQSNPDALVMWVQEVMSRAYALHVLASAVPRWQLLGPGGAVVMQSAPGTAVQLAQALLSAHRPTKQKVVQPSAAGAGKGKNSSNLQEGKASGKQQQPQQHQQQQHHGKQAQGPQQAGNQGQQGQQEQEQQQKGKQQQQGAGKAAAPTKQQQQQQQQQQGGKKGEAKPAAQSGAHDPGQGQGQGKKQGKKRAHQDASGADAPAEPEPPVKLKAAKQGSVKGQQNGGIAEGKPSTLSQAAPVAATAPTPKAAGASKLQAQPVSKAGAGAAGNGAAGSHKKKKQAGGSA